MTIKAIETQYKNYRFRSRLEAKWAYFFDLLALKWEYEPEGFDVEGAWYLPDFRVTSPQGYISWYEIKPADAPDSTKMKIFEEAHRKQEQLNYQVTEEFNWSHVSFETLAGDPFHVLFEKEEFVVCPRCGCLLKGKFDDWVGDIAYNCTACDYGTPSGSGEVEKGLLGEVCPHKGWILVNPIENQNILEFLEHYAGRARKARFEHGETPKI